MTSHPIPPTPRRPRAPTSTPIPTPVDGARAAFDRPRRLTPARLRVVRAAARLWCRDLRFPSVRAIGSAAGLRSPSTVVGGAGIVDLQAAVIAWEWRQIERGWVAVPPVAAAGWLADHGRALLADDPTLLRLPGLVVTAVAGAGVLPYRMAPDDLVPLLGLAALAGTPDDPVHPDDVDRLVLDLIAAPTAIPLDRPA